MENRKHSRKNFLEWLQIFVSLLRWPLVVLFLILILENSLPVASSQLSFVAVAQGTLELLKVTIWPMTLLLLAYSFREIVTYLFFSMREFNFFGAKGKLKNVQEMIDEKANQKYENMVREEQIVADRQKTQDDLEKVKKSKDSLQERYDEVLRVANEQNDQIAVLQTKVADVDKLIDEERDKERNETIDFILDTYELAKKTPLALSDEVSKKT